MPPASWSKSAACPYPGRNASDNALRWGCDVGFTATGRNRTARLYPGRNMPENVLRRGRDAGNTAAARPSQYDTSTRLRQVEVAVYRTRLSDDIVAIGCHMVASAESVLHIERDRRRGRPLENRPVIGCSREGRLGGLCAAPRTGSTAHVLRRQHRMKLPPATAEPAYLASGESNVTPLVLPKAYGGARKKKNK